MHQPFSGENPFLFTESKTTIDKKEKKFFPREPKEIDYEELFEGEYDEKEIHEQIKTTYSSFQEKELKSNNEIFYVIKPKVAPSDYGIEELLSRLKADIVDYLDEKHQNFIVRSSPEVLDKLARGKKIPKKISDNTYQIRSISEKDQVSEEVLRKSSEKMKPVAIAIMPNSMKDEKKMYFEMLKSLLINQNKEIKSFFDENLVFAMLNSNDIELLLKKSSFIHFIEIIPNTLAEGLDLTNNKKMKTIPSGIEPLTISYTKPKVVVMDTGINKITPLENLLQITDSYNYNDNDDMLNHGTPVGSLVALGENLDEPKIDLISYKILEKKDQADEKPFAGMMNGIKKYCEKTRLFLSSLNFEDISPKLESKLDKLIQQSNIIFVNSVGNIDARYILQNISQEGYPHYIHGFEVMSPSICPTVISVGSLAKTSYPDDQKIKSIAKINEIAPYSRCGTKNPFLYSIEKPEVTEYGANLNLSENQINFDMVGTSSFDKDGNAGNFYGTSFSAPLVVRKICELETYYGKNINNAETFKALSYLGCKSQNSKCIGYGLMQKTVGCDDDHSLYYSEGVISLRGETTKAYYEEPYSEISIKVPYSADRIDLCLVHSDFFSISNYPILNTFLKVDAYKTARASKVLPDNISDNEKVTNVKFLTYSFQSRSMEGTWTFKIYPQLTAKIPNRYKKDIQIRYGIAMLISRRDTINKKISLNREITLMK